MRHLLDNPETVCPKCGNERVAWAKTASVARAQLACNRLLSGLVQRLVPVRLCCSNCHELFSHLHSLPRTVVGYHGCEGLFSHRLVTGRVNHLDWKASQNNYDWLGQGIYFWEDAPGRAWQWARQQYRGKAAVVAAEIRLGRCLDLADTAFAELLRESFEGTVNWYRQNGWDLPKNEGKEFKLRRLDRVVIDRLTRATDKPNGAHYQTVRCPFEEGDPVYPGAMIRSQSHIQIAVRDNSCIVSRVFPVEAMEV